MHNRILLPHNYHSCLCLNCQAKRMEGEPRLVERTYQTKNWHNSAEDIEFNGSMWMVNYIHTPSNLDLETSEQQMSVEAWNKNVVRAMRNRARAADGERRAQEVEDDSDE